MKDKDKLDQVELKQPLEDEEIIELTDEIKVESEERPEAIKSTDVAGAPGVEDEEPIELSFLEDDSLKSDVGFDDDIDMEPVIDQNAEGDFVDSMGMDLESEIDILEDLPEAEKPDFALEPEEAPDELEQLIADVTGDSQKEPDIVSVHEHEPASDTFSLPPEQLEETLERVIKKMFSEKIESILTEVIEKVVTREIEKLKSILLEDVTGGKIG